MSCIIRRAVTSDYQGIVDIEKIIFGFEVTERYFLEYLSSKSNIVYVADIDGKVVGVLCAERQWNAFAKNTCYYLRNCGVMPEYRRRGIYTDLINRIKNRLLMREFIILS